MLFLLAYRYGFQGQEKNDELKGNGNSVNYKYRMHDARLGRFFSVDPMFKMFSYNSPYAFCENRVIDAIELEGLEKHIYYLKKEKIDGKVQLKKVYSETIEGYTDANGNFVKYEEQWQTVNDKGFTTFTRNFDSKEEMDDWDPGVNFLDNWMPKQTESFNSFLEGLLLSGAGQKGANRAIANDLLTAITVREFRKLQKKVSLVVVVGSFSDADNAQKYAQMLKDKYPDANIRILPENKDGNMRVIAEDYELGNTADALELRNLAKKEGIEDAWITTVSKEDLRNAECIDTTVDSNEQ